VITVTPRARRHTDRNGDPLDGLVNLFDIGIVLALGFLLAALSSLHLTDAITRNGLSRPSQGLIDVDPNAQVSNLPTPGARTIGRGSQVGTVYQLEDGRLVFVKNPGATPTPTSAPTPTPGATPTPTAAPTTP
jgi:hypothetical protein